MTADAIRTRLCVRRKPELARKMSTVIKVMTLDGWIMDCDGKEWETKATPLARKIINGPGGEGGKAGGGKGGGKGGGTGGGGGGGLFDLFGGLFGSAPKAYYLSDGIISEERVVDPIYARILAMPNDKFDPVADEALERHLDEVLAGVDLTSKRTGSAKERRGMAMEQERQAMMELLEAEAAQLVEQGGPQFVEVEGPQLVEQGGPQLVEQGGPQPFEQGDSQA
jgi:hypothetical protein